MKRNILLTLALTISISTLSFGQDLGDQWYTLDFDDNFQLHHLIIDSISNQNNLWQVGIPQKTVFTSAYSLPSAVVTDTINSYAVNDTSIFEIINLAVCCGWELAHTVILSGYYQVNTDTITDYGKIEVSPDNGTTWIDLVNDTAYSAYYNWYSPVPVLSGNSNGWKQFYVWYAALGPLFNIQYGDTILYRFTFISDSIQTNKDGLMFDDLHFEDWAEGIQEIQIDNLISISPNPTNENFYIHKTDNNNNNKESIQIFNYTGKLVFENSNFIGEPIDTRQLNNGIYLLKYSDNKNYSMKKFVVQH